MFAELRNRLLPTAGGLFAATCGLACPSAAGNPPTPPSPPPTSLRIEIVPPSPVTEQVTVDMRAALVNASTNSQTWRVGLYLDRAASGNELRHTQVRVAPRSSVGVCFHWPAIHHPGLHRLILVARRDGETLRAGRPLRILASSVPSTLRIGGAWCGIYHWSEKEGRHWNAQIKRMSDSQWRGVIRAMHEIGMNIVIIQEAFHSQKSAERNCIASKDYHGRAFYRSKLYPARMPIAAKDPFEAILSEADRLGMHVFVPVGLYAWFDYSPASLAWHEKVARELWNRYGSHPSFYGWYVSEEVGGNLGPDERHRHQIVNFFRQFRPYVRRLAPEKPVMLACNCHGIGQALNYYPQLLANVDILSPFGFDRMPAGDLTGPQAAALLQKLCKASGTHLWLDMEVFLFDKTGALVPRPVQQITQSLHTYTRFEETLCYQFPGLMTAPWMRPRLGGQSAVRLYRAYRRYFDGLDGKKKGLPRKCGGAGTRPARRVPARP